MPDIKKALTRKLGPLPTWAWGVLAAGGVWAWRAFDRQENTEPTGDGAFAEDLPFTPSTPPSSIDPGFGAPGQVTGTQTGRVSIGTPGGGMVDVEGPFDFIERILPDDFGGVLQPPPAPRPTSPAPPQPTNPRPPAPPKQPPVKRPVIRKPTPVPIDPDLKIKQAILQQYKMRSLPGPGMNSATMRRLVGEVKAGRPIAGAAVRPWRYSIGGGLDAHVRTLT